MTDLLTNVFSNDAFSVTSLTNAIVQMPHVAVEFDKQIAWSIEKSYTKTFAIDLEQHRVYLLGTVARGEPLPNAAPSDRQIVSVNIPRFGERASVLVDEILDRRTTGMIEQTSLEDLRNQKLMLIQSRIRHTSNFAKARSLDGVVVDAISGRVLTNFFTLFNMTQPTVNFDFTNATLDPNELLGVQKRIVEDAVGDAYINVRGYKLLCGRNFYRKMRQNAQIQKAWLVYDALVDTAQRLGATDLNVPGGFKLADDVIVMDMGRARFPLYDSGGNKIGTNGFIDDDSAYLVIDADGAAHTAYGPSSALPFVGNVLPYYVVPRIRQDLSGIDMFVDSFEVNYWDRPDLIVKITSYD